MFNSISMTGVGGIITVIFTVLRLFGVDVPEDTAAKFGEAVVTVVGVVLLVIGQLRRKDLVGGLVRK